ncbi:MAG: 50S ribosomal protein L10 [Treponema sp.]|nr:50S ribosomal protein L10 [Candidatus Treponema scatequi]
MAITKVQPAKAEAIEAAKKTLGEYNDFIFTEYRGLTVEQITTLRDKLRASNSAIKVIKNNFAKIAFKDLNVENVEDYLSGPTAIAMAKEDSNETAKILFDFAKEVPALQIKGAYVNKEIYDTAKIEAYSKVPGKKQLIAMLMSAINGPAQKLAATLQAYVDKLEKEGPAAAAPKAEAAPAEAAPAAEAPAAEAAAEAPQA